MCTLLRVISGDGEEIISSDETLVFVAVIRTTAGVTHSLADVDLVVDVVGLTALERSSGYLNCQSKRSIFYEFGILAGTRSDPGTEPLTTLTLSSTLSRGKA